ncbi:prepilin peptidase [Evansella sp. AB-P1]|uniref:prepilin peptidase n=1 Tax=Evansella sp. AB-P1 TaxID=3037653 RepID=UPI00241FA642|nr:A24 family peptidase [Evansella sp. AB-P1]MDG5786860.1 prepilin peptidase [Evansella sp. AB-P1]
MDIILHAYLFVLGAVLGSFYNVVGLRVAKGESFVRPRSHCPNCKHVLSWLELIPVLSYIFQKGKCKKCKKRISPIYPIFEGLTAVLFTISPLMVGWSKELLIALALISLLMIITVSDLKTMLIPNKIVAFFFVLFIVLRFIEPLSPWWDSIVGSVVGFTILLLLAIVSKGGMGGGDIKLFAVLGIVLGLQGTLLTLFFASLLGAIIGGIGLIIKKTKKGVPIPFGPFIAAGCLISYFYSATIMDWYIHLL